MKLQRTDPKFSVGQKVIFVNCFGVNWGEKEITEHQWDEIRGNVYHYKPSDTPWFMTSERHLYTPDDTAAIANAEACGRILASEQP